MPQSVYTPTASESSAYYRRLSQLQTTLAQSSQISNSDMNIFNNTNKVTKAAKLLYVAYILKSANRSAIIQSHNTLLSTSPNTIYADSTSSAASPINKISQKLLNKKLISKRYIKAEDFLLNNLESLLSLFDNFIIVQNVFKSNKLFKSLSLNPKYSKLIPIIVSFIKKLSNIYIFVIIIRLRRLMIKLINLNKLIKLVELETELNPIIHSKILTDSTILDDQDKEKLMILYTSKTKTILDLIGYSNELILNLELGWKNFILPKWLNKLSTITSWIIGIYRFSKNEDEEIKEEAEIHDLKKIYGV